MEGETILEEAEKFSNRLLKEKMMYLDQNQVALARNTLKHPFHKSLARITAKQIRGNFNGFGKLVQEVAKLDDYVMQSIHQEEVLHVSRYIILIKIKKN